MQSLLECLDQHALITLDVATANKLFDYMLDNGYDLDDYRQERIGNHIEIWKA